MQFEIIHNTHYTYDAPTSYLIQLLRLTPRTGEGQRVLNWNISAPARLHPQTDAFGNHSHLLTLSKPIQYLDINVRGTIEVADNNSSHRFAGDLGLSPLIFTQATRFTAADAPLHDFAQDFKQGEQFSETQALRLVEAIHERIVYTSGATEVTTLANEAFALGQGVCQDQAHVFLACAHAIGIPARYVSGYLNTGDEGHLASHAWIDVYTDAHEWLSLDITHNCITDGRYCRLAIGRDYETAAPVRGTRMGGGAEVLNAYVYVSAQGAQGEQEIAMQQQ